jgi:hypothetical protein
MCQLPHRLGGRPCFGFCGRHSDADMSPGRVGCGAEGGNVTSAYVVHGVPLDRAGTSQENLASDEASFVTGESVLIDGGLVRF